MIIAVVIFVGQVIISVLIKTLDNLKKLYFYVYIFFKVYRVFLRFVFVLVCIGQAMQM